MSRRRDLSDAERALWRRVTRDVAAYGAADSEEDAAAGRVRGAEEAVRPRPAIRPSVKAAKPSKGAPPSAFGAGDPRLDRRLRRRSGRLAVDRVLDLHGLNEIQAHLVFERTIADAAAAGCRCVLVVTGKGGAASATAMARRRLAPDRNPGDEDDRYNDYRDERRGVLRRRFLEWIDSPRVRSLIARVSKARPKDGGDGAFYVFLKGARRDP